MTIGIGFAVREGIVMCADSQWTGAHKSYQTKITREAYGDSRVVFVLSGSEDYGKLAVELCSDAISEQRDKTTKSIRKAIRKCVKQIFEDYIDKRPSMEQDHVGFQLLAGISTKGDDAPILLRSNGPCVSMAKQWAFIGTGGYLAHYLLESVYRTNMGFSEGALLVCRALATVKRYDPYCGGDSEIVLLHSNGRTLRLKALDTLQLESTTVSYEKQVTDILTSIANLDEEDSRLEKQLQEFIQEAKRTRYHWKTQARSFQTKIRNLDGSK